MKIMHHLIIVAGVILATTCQRTDEIRTVISDYRVFYDNQNAGYGTIFGSVAAVNDSIWWGVFNGGGKYQDDEIGMNPFSTTTTDAGHTWAKPDSFASQLIKDPERGSTVMRIFGPTKNGTALTVGYQYQNGSPDSAYFEDVQWRTYKLIIGRRPAGVGDFTYEILPSGTFLGEQFVEGGLQLPDGRIVLTIWGAKHHDENWRCGVLLSDDDGKSWKYRDVAYEADKTIRDKQEVVAGFNEQTLFLSKDGKLISIIRGREKLGRLADSPTDTWFFRAESTDRGETWSAYEKTDLAGTGGAFGAGITLPDGSLLQACRVPYARSLYSLQEQDLFGLHIVRSFDEGKSWHTEHVIQRDPDGKPFKDYYNVMNGQFLKIDDGEWLYHFGQFDVADTIFRVLSLRIASAANHQ